MFGIDPSHPALVAAMTRYVLYSHDTYGLGHFRRSSLLATGLVGADPNNEVLIITGSPSTQAFPLPDRVDTVKLPTATKDVRGRYQPRRLLGSIDRLTRLRRDIILAATTTFEPEVLLVDHAPLGMRGELSPTLSMLDRRRDRPRLTLGLRDIIDQRQAVEQSWHRDRVWPALDRFDDIFVYGDRRVRTTAQEIGLERRTGAVVTHTGYVAPTMPEALPGDPFVLVTPGGGGDGQRLLRRYLDAVEAGATAGLRSVVITGPLLSARRQAELLLRAEKLESVELIEFSDSMRSLIASAEFVVSMAGYNTVVEELSAGTPALLVPRCKPRLEQHIRACRLAPVSRLEHCPIEELSPDRVRRFARDQRTLRETEPSIDLSGIARVVSTLTGSNSPERTPAHV